MAKKTIKQIIADEYQLCAKDPIHFMRKYCYIQHPTKGKILFNLFEFQERSLVALKENDYNIILKSRQLGISTLTAGYALWSMTFNNDFNTLVIATKQEVAKNLVTKVRVMHHYLPSWLKNSATEDNKLSLRFENGSQIKAISSGGDAGRSEALSLLVIDEAAFIDRIDEIWASSQQTLATGGDCIVLSTPNGVGNWFHQQWVGAEYVTNEFNTI
jgi:phage FluMu gp28-like protein